MNAPEDTIPSLLGNASHLREGTPSPVDLSLPRDRRRIAVLLTCLGSGTNLDPEGGKLFPDNTLVANRYDGLTRRREILL